MDSVRRYEFHEIFDRVTADIDLKDCLTALAIEEKLKEARDRSKAKFKMSKSKTHRAKAGGKIEWLNTLIERDFASRVIFEANRDPRGLVSYTLKYGRKQARVRILAQRRAQLRSRGAFAVVPRRVSRIPEYRRIPTYRRRFRSDRS